MSNKIYAIRSSADTNEPREAVYGSDPLAYRSREKAEQVAADYNERAKAEGWGWSYEIEEIDADLHPSVGGIATEDVGG